jgi:hypothetical protein
MSLLRPLLPWTASLLLACAAQAQTIPILNASFEANAAPAGGFPVLVPDHWILYDPDGIVDQNHNAVGVLNPTGTTFFTNPNGVPDGSNAALIYLEQVAGTTAIGSPVGLFQPLDAGLTANTRYTLTVRVGNIASGTGLGPFASFGFTDLSGFPGYRVELLAGGAVVASDDNSVAIGEGQFGLVTVELLVGANHAQLGQGLGVRLINLNATGLAAERGREVDFDQVALLASPVPEPATAALWVGGLMLLGMRWSLHVQRRREARSFAPA